MSNNDINNDNNNINPNSEHSNSNSNNGSSDSDYEDNQLRPFPGDLGFENHSLMRLKKILQQTRQYKFNRSVPRFEDFLRLNQNCVYLQYERNSLRAAYNYLVDFFDRITYAEAEFENRIGMGDYEDDDHKFPQEQHYWEFVKGDGEEEDYETGEDTDTELEMYHRYINDNNEDDDDDSN